MSQEYTNQDGPEITLEASTDLSAKQFRVMTIDANGQVKTADDADVAAEPMLGVLQNKPSAQGQEAVVRVEGVAKVIYGGSLDEGTWVTTDASGYVVAAVANDNVLGFTLDAGASGEIGRVKISQAGGFVVPV